MDTRRAGKSIQSALNVYQWLKTAKTGSKARLFFHDRIIDVVVSKIKEPIGVDIDFKIYEDEETQ
jgi:hypothetical protein